MSLDEEPCSAHPQEFINDYPLRIMKIKFFLHEFSNKAGNNSGDKKKRYEEEKRRMEES